MQGIDTAVDESTSVNDIEEISFMESNKDITTYMSFDDKGRLIVEGLDDSNDEEVSIDDDDASTIPSEDAILDKIEREYAVFMLDSVLVDMTPFYGKPIAQKIHEALWNSRSTDSTSYKLLYLANGDIRYSGFNVLYSPNGINDTIRGIVEEEGVFI